MESFESVSNWSAYHRGWRTARREKRLAEAVASKEHLLKTMDIHFIYYMNGYPHQSSEWHSFNIGWNDYIQGINLHGWER